MSDQPVTILCLASYYKGVNFINAAKALGARVLLLTRENLADEPWPRENIDDLLLMPDLRKRPDIIYAVSYLMRGRKIDAIVPLDDYDVETAAALREHLRLPGLGESTARYFRDKLAMRMQAAAHGIPVPPFTPTFSYDRLREYMARVPPPWVLKPRSEAGAMGIKKMNSAEDVWRRLDELGDDQSFFHLEKFVPGEIYHVDSLVDEGKLLFSQPHKYARPPMTVAHDGGVFVSRTLPDGDESRAILDLNARLLRAFGLERGAAHAEFIRGADGQYYFLEVAARVGGANIEYLVEAAAGLNLWAEWARMEVAYARGENYAIPARRHDYAGILTCLARQEWPDTSAYDDPEVVYRVNKKHHAGLIVASPDPGRVEWLLGSYAERFGRDFLAVLPPLEKAPL
ncbi:MAG: ATP-grasp domain-containing protein [Anaerolineae bacterium]|nr:ATP-grasp domain-containing protein [Anaerolineae bacterium]